MLAHHAQLGRARALRAQAEARLAGTGNGVACRIPQDHIAGGKLLADALQHQSGGGVGHLGQLHTGGPRLGGHVFGHGIKGHPRQIHTGHQRPLHLDIEPAFNGPRDKLVRHHIDQQPGQQANQPKNGGQLDQETATKAPTPQPHNQAHAHPQQHRQQQHGHQHIDPEQPRIVALVKCPVVGGQGEHEKQHHSDGRHDGGPHAHGPAHRTRLPGQGLGRSWLADR